MPQPALMPHNIPPEPSTNIGTYSIAWLTGRGHIEEAIKSASVLAPQDTLSSTKFMVKNDENIHFRELEPKLCYWGDQSGDTVLVQLSTEGYLS